MEKEPGFHGKEETQGGQGQVLGVFGCQAAHFCQLWQGDMSDGVFKYSWISELAF